MRPAVRDVLLDAKMLVWHKADWQPYVGLPSRDLSVGLKMAGESYNHHGLSASEAIGRAVYGSWAATCENLAQLFGPELGDPGRALLSHQAHQLLESAMGCHPERFEQLFGHPEVLEAFDLAIAAVDEADSDNEGGTDE